MPKLRTTSQAVHAVHAEHEQRKQATVPAPTVAIAEQSPSVSPEKPAPRLEDRLPELKLEPVTIFMAALTEQGQILKAKTSPYLIPQLARLQAVVDEVQKLTAMRVVGLGIGRTLHQRGEKGWMTADEAIAGQIKPLDLPVVKGRVGYRGLSITAGPLTTKIAVPGCRADAPVDGLARALAGAAGQSGSGELEVRENTNQSYSVGTDDPIPATANKYRMWATSAAKRGRDADVNKNLEAYETWMELRRQVIATGIWGEMGKGRRASGPTFVVRAPAPVAEMPVPSKQTPAQTPSAEPAIAKPVSVPVPIPKPSVPAVATPAHPVPEADSGPTFVVHAPAQTSQTPASVEPLSADPNLVLARAMQAQAEAMSALAERLRLDRRADRRAINTLAKALMPAKLAKPAKK